MQDLQEKFASRQGIELLDENRRGRFFTDVEKRTEASCLLRIHESYPYDELAILAVAVIHEHTHLIERGTQIGRAEILVLVVFQSILIVEMNAG